MRHRAFVSIGAILLGSVALAVSVTRHSPRIVRAFDDPDAAAAYYAARRVPAAATIDPRERYRAAGERMTRMPRYATVGPRRFPSVRDSGSTSGALGSWTSLGPGNIGGRTRVLRIDPTRPDRMYAGGVSGGIWKTEDAGRNWRPIGDRLANLAINAMAMSPRDPQVIFVGTGEGYFREDVRYTGLPLRGAGIFVTRNGGESWAQIPATLTSDFLFVNDLEISGRDDRVVYAATRSGVWRSRDSGASWAQVLAAGVRGGCLDLALRTDGSSDVLFAACGTFEQATVYRAFDAQGAAVFAPVLSEPGMGRTALAIAPSSQNVLYAMAASNTPGPNGVYEQGLFAVFRSNDGGAPGTWFPTVRNTDAVKLRTLILTNPIAASFADCRMGAPNSYTTMGWYVASLAVDPADAETVWAAGVDWFRSRDGGRTWGVVSQWWQEGAPGFVHADQHALIFHPAYNGASNQQAFALTDGGIYRTDNARALDSRDLCSPASIQVAWTSLNHNFGVTQFYHGLPFPDGSSFFGGTQDNGTILGTTSDGPDGWINVFGGDGGYVALDAANPRVVYVESQWGNIARSGDGGRTFSDATAGLDPPRSSNLHGDRADFLFITPFVADPGARGTLWTGGRYIYRRVGTGRADASVPDSADAPRGRTRDRRREAAEGGEVRWERVGGKLLDDGLVSAVTVATADSDRVAAGATDGRIYVTESGRATAEAVRWQIARPREAWVTSIAHDPRNPDVMYATYGGFGGAHVFKSANAGRTWRSIDGIGDAGLPDIPVHSVVVDPGRADRVYLGTDLGVFVSDTGGDTWSVEQTGFGAVVTEWLAPLVTPDGARWLFAFTHGRGAWKVRLD